VRQGGRQGGREGGRGKKEVGKRGACGAGCCCMHLGGGRNGSKDAFPELASLHLAEQSGRHHTLLSVLGLAPSAALQ